MSTRHSAQSAAAAPGASDLIGDIQYYLTLMPRQLPSRYLYDALGSALFDAICELPWYAITRSELTLLEQQGKAVFGHLPGVTQLVELGPGNGSKMKTLVERGRRGSRHLEIHLIDVSATALERASRTLETIEHSDIVLHVATYEVGLQAAAAEAAPGDRTLVLFLGSNIGNFDRPGADEFLCGVRSALAPGDALLLGADLVKPERDLLLAYDDPLGVTAAFNKNLLVRINRELAGKFDIDAFSHRAVWNAAESRVEMHLVSTRRQRVCLEAAGLDFTMEAGETIWTESSYKYEPAELRLMLERAGFAMLGQWVVDGFALTLMKAC